MLIQLALPNLETTTENKCIVYRKMVLTFGIIIYVPEKDCVSIVHCMG